MAKAVDDDVEEAVGSGGNYRDTALSPHDSSRSEVSILVSRGETFKDD